MWILLPASGMEVLSLHFGGQGARKKILGTHKCWYEDTVLGPVNSTYNFTIQKVATKNVPQYRYIEMPGHNGVTFGVSETQALMSHKKRHVWSARSKRLLSTSTHRPKAIDPPHGS